MVNSHPCVAESITVQSITSKPSDFNNLLWPEVLWIGWSVLTPPAVVGWSLDSARALERAEMVGPHSPSGPSLQLLLGMADWRSVMRRRNRCGRAPYVWVSETCIMSILPIGQGKSQARPHSKHQRHIFKGHVRKKGENSWPYFFIQANKTLFQNRWGGTNNKAA